MPYIGAAIAVEIDGIFVEFRRQELREPQRAAPGRTHVGARHAVLQHLQGVQEFVLEELLALADIGLRRQHADCVVRKLVAAIVGFARPDRQHDIAGHAKFFFDAGERVAVLHGELPPARGQTIKGCFAQILRGRLDELRLLRGFLRLAGNGEVGKREIGLETARGSVEGRARDAECLCRGPFGDSAIAGTQRRLHAWGSLVPQTTKLRSG